MVLTKAKLAFGDTPISVKLPGIYWWYETNSHAAELTAGYYNSVTRDGYAPIASMLKKHEAALNLTCVDLATVDEQKDFPEAKVDPEGLLCQLQVKIHFHLPCYDSEEYDKILEHVKPRNVPAFMRLSAFTYDRLNQDLLEEDNLKEFQLFVKRMHGNFSPSI
ncbi:putative beta-amylase [Helianthus anomalus]